jgi:phospholipid/cholesterol/gamma-HCH transport system substrate-binding protein
MFKATAAQKTKLGLFLLAAGVLLAAVLVLFAGLSMMEEADRYYVSTSDSVSGLRVGASVELRGVDVGQVAEVALDWKRTEPVIVAIDLAVGTPVPAGARAVLRMKGVTGLKYLDLEGGDFHSALRRPGDTIPAAPSALSDITDKGRALVDESRQLVQRGTRAADRIGDLLADDNRARIEQMLVRGERAMADMERAAAQMARSGERLEQLIAGEGKRAMAEAGALLGDARRLVQANRHPIAATIADLREAARSLRRMAQVLEREPSRLLFGRKRAEGGGR